MNIILEFDGVWGVTEEHVAAGLNCAACHDGFHEGEKVVSVVERFTHFSYVIHPSCENLLYYNICQAEKYSIEHENRGKYA